MVFQRSLISKRACSGRPAFGWTALASLLVLFVASGASCPRRIQQTGPQSPIAFTQTPGLSQIIATVNANTDRVQRMKAEGATLAVSGAPSLRTELALERPRKFRMIAGLILGTELDLGSNDELFWLWAKRNEPAAIYYAKHADVANGISRQILPLPPTWLIEALGLVTLDPQGRWEGPFARGNGRIEIRTQVDSTSGVLNKVYIVDDQRGLVLEQHVYDASGQLLATALASAHAYNEVNGVTLPRRIDIQLPPAGMAFTLEVDGYLLNTFEGAGDQLWSMPQIDNTPLVPLTNSASNTTANPAGTIGWNNAAEFMPR